MSCASAAVSREVTAARDAVLSRSLADAATRTWTRVAPSTQMGSVPYFVTLPVVCSLTASMASSCHSCQPLAVWARTATVALAAMVVVPGQVTPTRLPVAGRSTTVSVVAPASSVGSTVPLAGVATGLPAASLGSEESWTTFVSGPACWTVVRTLSPRACFLTSGVMGPFLAGTAAGTGACTATDGRATKPKLRPRVAESSVVPLTRVVREVFTRGSPGCRDGRVTGS